jgi:hypothetical protein
MSHHKSWVLISLGLLLISLGTLVLILLLFYWEQSLRDKQPNFVTSDSKSSLSAVIEKEAKVTSLDPALIFNSHHELQEQMGSKENLKEVNILQTTLKTNQDQLEQLAKVLESKSQEFQKLEEENQQSQLKAQQTAQDFADYKLFSEEQLKQKQLQLATLQQIIEDQRLEMEKRQEQISQLDTKVHDLSYEIKTLLYLHEEENTPSKTSGIKEEISHVFRSGNIIESHEIAVEIPESPINSDHNILETPVRTPMEAANLLKKCVNIAQKLTGANYYHTESSRYREFSSSYNAIDQRRLFDNLRSETGALIIVYSQKEHKLLFVNNESKTLLGWSPEKFVADFASSSIMQGGMNDWKKALSFLATGSDSQARLLLKTKQGQEVLLNCHLGVISTGLFRNYIIGILYPT